MTEAELKGIDAEPVGAICGGIREATDIRRFFIKCTSKKCKHMKRRLHIGWLENYYGWTWRCKTCGRTLFTEP